MMQRRDPSDGPAMCPHCKHFICLRAITGKCGTAILVACVLAMSGCATTGALTVKVPVAVPCKQAVPERPEMPTEHFTHKPGLDEFVQGALAEIERREGYEIELREALIACTRETS